MRILSMSGFVPEQICDIIRFIGYQGDGNISHYCGYASDYISQVLHDESVDGAVFPKSCDSSRIISSYLHDTNKFIHQINVPARRDALAVDYYALEIKRYQKNLEEYYGIKCTDILERTELINRRNFKIKELYNCLENIEYSEYLKSIHKLITQPLDEQIITSVRGNQPCRGKRVYLVGSFLSSMDCVKLIESSGFNVVGDNLPESGRIASMTAIGISGDIYHNISYSIMQNRMSPSQSDFREIIKSDLMEISNKRASAVIFVTQKYCETYNYLYYIYKKALEKINIPYIKIELTDSEDSKKIQITLEAFADTIK